MTVLYIFYIIFYNNVGGVCSIALQMEHCFLAIPLTLKCEFV